MNIKDATRLATLHQIFDEPLTDQQKDIILMYAMGVTVTTISDIKGIAVSTVKKHLDNVRIEFNLGSLHAIKSILLIRLMALSISPVVNG